MKYPSTIRSVLQNASLFRFEFAVFKSRHPMLYTQIHTPLKLSVPTAQRQRHTALYRHTSHCIHSCYSSGTRIDVSSKIDSYPTINVYCTNCSIHLFRYKKKNGTKSSLVKCYIERIIEDCVYILRDQYYNHSNNNTNTSSASNHNSENNNNNNSGVVSSSGSKSCEIKHDKRHHHDRIRLQQQKQQQQHHHTEYYCPNCETKIARYARIHNLPCLKWVGGKIRMTKK